MDKAKGFMAEFKKFISRGNVVDMAVGVVVGGAFTGIVNSLVKDIIMPMIGMLFGGIDFTGLKYVITPAEGDVAEAAIYYGNFIQNIVNFLLVAFAIFIVIKAMNSFHKKKEEAAPPPPPPVDPDDVVLLREIRDLLKKD
ncbi:MAG: large-conductance mechanosensitive channel protein MscL [Oscillospiraceae bacterium]|nr:large-conductance mechanosensitive channel protein MscL [Oscillospiraceae bacterium]